MMPFNAQVVWQTTNIHEIRYDTLCLESTLEGQVMADVCDSQQQKQAFQVNPASQVCRNGLAHTPNTAFQHLPPNSARFGYATEGALFISARLSTDAVSALRKVWVLI